VFLFIAFHFHEASLEEKYATGLSCTIKPKDQHVMYNTFWHVIVSSNNIHRGAENDCRAKNSVALWSTEA